MGDCFLSGLRVIIRDAFQQNSKGGKKCVTNARSFQEGIS
jgi:hypothetical protein